MTTPHRFYRLSAATIATLTTAILALMLMSLAGCGESRPQKLGTEEYKGATSSSATVRVVSEDPALKQRLPSHSAVLSRSADLADKALQVEQAREDDAEQVGASLITAEELAVDPVAAAASVDEQVTALEHKIEKEQTTGFWEKVLQWSGWATVGALGVWVLRRLGVPGIGLLTDPLVRKVGGKYIDPLLEKQAEAEKQVGDLAATVEGSMVGRYALKELDKAMSDRFQDEIEKFTGGSASTLEGLFKWASRSHAVDNPDVDSNAVAGVVDWVKDRLSTSGMVPDILKNLLK